MNTLNILKRTFGYSYRQANKKCFSTKISLVKVTDVIFPTFQNMHAPLKSNQI